MRDGILSTLEARRFLVVLGLVFWTDFGTEITKNGLVVPRAVVSVGMAVFFEPEKLPSSENGGGASEIGWGSGSCSIFATGGSSTFCTDSALKTLRSGIPL